MVSVIIPTYNYARFIGDALNSLVTQVYPDFECLVIDNGSTDNTSEIIKPFLKDKRFKYIVQDNRGVSVGRNTGLKLAKGDYILFLDADDLIEKNKLEAAVYFLEMNREVSLVYSDMRYFKAENQGSLYYSYSCDEKTDAPWMKYASGKGTEIVASFLGGNNMVISSPVFRSSLLPETGLFDEHIQHNEDWDFWFRIVLAGKKIQYLDAPGTKTLIRIHKTSASVNVFKMQVCGLFVLLKNSGKINAYGLNKALEERIKEHKKAMAQSLLRIKTGNDFKSSIDYIKELNLYDELFAYKTGKMSFVKLYLRLKLIFGI
jgi:glycosyltransferase involved in cell wall biosynthesis